MGARLRRFLNEQSGATAVEYGLIASLIAGAVIATLVALGPEVAGTFQAVIDAYAAASEG